MEGNRRSFFKQHENPQFKRKGGNKKGKRHRPNLERSFWDSHASDTVYRILCESRKIGSVIGRGGSIVKALREETQAKITVAESVHGSDERVITIFSPPTQIPRKYDADHSDEDPASDKEDDLMEPHCAAQDALLKVHDRIIEEDLLDGIENGDDKENVVTARLLVSNNMVGCILGRKGDVIQRLRSETGATVRVLPAEHLPTCAMNTDQLLQISGNPKVAKQALYDVSTLLHENPRKDKPHSNFPMGHGGQGFHPPPRRNITPPGNPIWSERNTNPHGMPPVPWMGEYGNQPSSFGPGGFNGPPAAHGGETPSEFSMKILCSAAKIGGVIGTGGFHVKHLQQETGASIHVEDVSAESDDRIIHVSSFEVLWNPRSQTIDAILQLQNKTSEYSDKGTITTKLLVPSSKVGCIIGQGGQVINEMRRRTHADIRVYSKEDKPKGAYEDDELVQISGNFGVAKDALAEIALRLRTRYLRVANAGAEPASVGSVPRLGPSGNLPGVRPPPYELWKDGRHEYEPPSYPVPPRPTGFQNVSNSMDVRIPNNAVNTVTGTGGNNIVEIAGTRSRLQDYQSGGSEHVEIYGSSEHLNATHSNLQGYDNTGGQHNNPQQGYYQNYDTQQGAYPNMTAPQTAYHIPQQDPYQNLNMQQAAYQNIHAGGSYQY